MTSKQTQLPADSMTDEQKDIFQKNIRYMFQKLSITYYQAKTSKSLPDGIQGADSLPAYASLSKFYNGQAVPSPNLLNKIVEFYNLNIQPQVTAYQFVNEYLSLTDAMRFTRFSNDDQRFLGQYCGYYYSGSGDDILGAMLKISKTESGFRASLITGIYTDSDLQSKRLANLFSDEMVSREAFEKYRKKLPTVHRRCHLYEGDVEFTKSSLLIHFRDYSEDIKKLTMMLDIKTFPAGNKKYKGGLAFVLTSSDGPYDAMFYLMGLRSINLEGFVSLTNETLAPLLSIRKTPNEHVALTSAADRAWFEFIIREDTQKINL